MELGDDLAKDGHSFRSDTPAFGFSTDRDGLRTSLYISEEVKGGENDKRFEHLGGGNPEIESGSVHGWSGGSRRVCN